MKKLFEAYPPDSPEYAVLHALWRKSRGKRPSIQAPGMSPRSTLVLAQACLTVDEQTLTEQARETLAQQEVARYFQDQPALEVIVV